MLRLAAGFDLMCHTLHALLLDLFLFLFDHDLLPGVDFIPYQHGFFLQMFSLNHINFWIKRWSINKTNNFVDWTIISTITLWNIWKSKCKACPRRRKSTKGDNRCSMVWSSNKYSSSIWRVARPLDTLKVARLSFQQSLARFALGGLCKRRVKVVFHHA